MEAGRQGFYWQRASEHREARQSNTAAAGPAAGRGHSESQGGKLWTKGRAAEVLQADYGEAGAGSVRDTADISWREVSVHPRAPQPPVQELHTTNAPAR